MPTGVDLKLPTELGHQRLHAVEQPEGRHTGSEHGQVGATKRRRAVM
jgi:hypothetical protein